MLSTSSSHYIQNTALYQLLKRKLTLSQPKSGQPFFFTSRLNIGGFNGSGGGRVFWCCVTVVTAVLETLTVGQVEMDSGDHQAEEAEGKSRGLESPGGRGSSVQTRSARALTSRAGDESHTRAAKRCDPYKKVCLGPDCPGAFNWNSALASGKATSAASTR